MAITEKVTPQTQISLAGKVIASKFLEFTCLVLTTRLTAQSPAQIEASVSVSQNAASSTAPSEYTPSTLAKPATTSRPSPSASPTSCTLSRQTSPKKKPSLPPLIRSFLRLVPFTVWWLTLDEHTTRQLLTLPRRSLRVCLLLTSSARFILLVRLLARLSSWVSRVQLSLLPRWLHTDLTRYFLSILDSFYQSTNN